MADSTAGRFSGHGRPWQFRGLSQSILPPGEKIDFLKTQEIGEPVGKPPRIAHVRSVDLDILYSNGDAFDCLPPRPRTWHGVQWLENRGELEFAMRRIAKFGGASSPQATDVDGDGDLDVVVVTPRPFPLPPSAFARSCVRPGLARRFPVESAARMPKWRWVMALLTSRRRAARSSEMRTEEESPPQRPVRRRRRWRLLAVVVLLAALVWFLPAIVAHTPLFGWILAKATADLRGTVTVGSTSLAWFSPIAARDVEICDPEGQPVLQAPVVSGNRSLAAILLDFSTLGQFRLEQPKLSIVLRGDGSNVEDLLAEYLVPTEEPSSVSVALQIVEGTISLTDQSSGQTWQIEGLELSLSTSGGADGELKLAASAGIPDPRQPGRLAVAVTTWQEDAEKRPAVTAGDLKVESDDLPLAMFGSLLGRFAPGTLVSGRLDCGIDAHFGGRKGAGETVVQAELSGEDLVLSAPWLGTDRVQLAHLSAACQVAGQQDRFAIQGAEIDCDLGSVSARGTLDLADRESIALSALLRRQSGAIEGRIDLARLAQMLPNTLRIREQTEIISGQVALSLVSGRDPQGPQPDAMIWRGKLEAANVKAVYASRQLAWEQPIRLTLAAYDTPQGPVVENLRCESDFLNLHAAGTPQQLAASASFNLTRLADQLGQFVDLGGISLAGEGWAQLNWTRSDEQRFEADAELQLRGFQLAMPQRQPWTEDELFLFLSSAGRTDLGADTQLYAALLEIKTPKDYIEVELAQPVLDLRGGGNWPVQVEARGQLEDWPARLRTWIALDEFRPAGAFTLSARATASAGRVSIAEGSLAAKQFQLLGPSLRIEEPSVELRFAGDCNLQQRRLELRPVNLASSSLSVQAERVLVELPQDSSPKISGTGKFQGDLGRLRKWIATDETEATWQIGGKLSGMAELVQSAGITNGQVRADVADLAVRFASGKQFSEPIVRLASRGSYEHPTRVLRFEQLDVAASSLAARTTGTINPRDERTDVHLSGQIDYDLAKLAGLLEPYVGSGVRIVGRGTSAVSYRGPLSPAGAEANAAVRWQQIDAYGFQVGPGELKAAMAEGIVRAEPLDLPVNGGRLTLAPQVKLVPEPIELMLPPGPVARGVQITPQMCASALKYIAPILADVSTAQGAFSIELDGCRVPLDDPAKGELAGRLTIHSVQVGPGPLVRELGILSSRATSATLRRESVVQFRMVDGRVHHQGLELVFPDLTIRTYGSVGLDQTMAVMAEMPIPPKWLGNNVLGSALREQTIRLPISGTLSSPKIDQREMQRLQAQFIENAARNVLEDELNRQLNRLFNP